MLSGHYRVVSIGFPVENKGMMLFLAARQKIFLLRHLFSASIIVCRFGGYHALIPMFYARIFFKPSLLILGGTEAHYFPSIRYGNSTKKFYRWATRLSLRMAKHLAPVDESLVDHRYTYDKEFPPGQGIKNIYPQVQTPYTVIHNGYDDTQFINLNASRKPNSFLTVANVSRDFEFTLKGIDLVLELAKRLPQCSFTIAGSPPGTFDSQAYPNVTLAGKVEYSKLPELYNKHEFYLQLSVAEGFPNTLCEAMLCGCIPIGSDVFSIPKIIGDTGFVLKRRNMDDLKALAETAMASDKAVLSQKARKKIAENYSLKRREEELLELIGLLTEKSQKSKVKSQK